jgi:hypothetical protein
MDQVPLHLFAYGEHLEGPRQRSLGYRLLTPVEPEPWSAEVEALARRLHAAPYPDTWPPTELFCSVLLSDGRRVVAIARYGLADHTVSQRRGGLELVGVVTPAGLGGPSALAIGHWLRSRRAAVEDLATLRGQVSLAEVLAAVSPTAPPREPVPILPIRLWQEGALLFAATGPADPDHHLGLLEQGASGAWQWLPLVGNDFPLPTFAQRGPLVAWTPHLAGVAVKLDQKAVQEEPRPRGWRPILAPALGGGLALLLAANLGALLELRHTLHTQRPAASNTEAPRLAPPPPARGSDESREQFAAALARLLQKEAGIREWNQAQLIGQYERGLAQEKGLQLDSPEGKAAVGAIRVLARRSPRQVEAAVREALVNKGFDPQLIDVACRRVIERLAAEAKESP